MEATLGDNEVTIVGSQDNEGTSAGDSSSASASQEETNNSLTNEGTTATPEGTDDSSQSTESIESIESIESQESDKDATQTSEPHVVIAK